MVPAANGISLAGSLCGGDLASIPFPKLPGATTIATLITETSSSRLGCNRLAKRRRTGIVNP